MAIELTPLPHREAIAYFQSKGFAAPDARFHHLDMWREEHARNFVVAKAARDDVLTAIRSELQTALAEGRTLDQFRTDLAPQLRKAGWWGKALMEDPQTGAMEEVQLGSMRRLRTIYDTNMRTAHAAGHWARIQRTKKAFPYLQYIQIERDTKRDDHARFHDKIWRVDDPIWLKIYPPNGWFCGCHVIQRTEGWMRRNNRTVSEPLDLVTEPYTNKRTGEVVDLPAGVHPGFDTNPGASWLDLADRWEAVTPDLTPAQRASERGVIEGLRLTGLRDRAERLAVVDANSDPVGLFKADPMRPNVVSIDLSILPERAGFLHSHLTEAGLSTPDFDTLDLGRAITAITPGGSLWRAVRREGAQVHPSSAGFASVLGQFQDELQGKDGRSVFAHARALWLERLGLITYTWKGSAQVEQMLDRNAGLIERLIDAALSDRT